MLRYEQSRFNNLQHIHILAYCVLNNICINFDLLCDTRRDMEAIIHNDQKKIMNEVIEEEKRLENEQRDNLYRD